MKTKQTQINEFLFLFFRQLYQYESEPLSLLLIVTSNYQSTHNRVLPTNHHMTSTTSTHPQLIPIIGRQPETNVAKQTERTSA